MPGSLTRGFLWSRWRGKRSRPSWRNQQFYVSELWTGISRYDLDCQSSRLYWKQGWYEGQNHAPWHRWLFCMIWIHETLGTILFIAYKRHIKKSSWTTYDIDLQSLAETNACVMTWVKCQRTHCTLWYLYRHHCENLFFLYLNVLRNKTSLIDFFEAAVSTLLIYIIYGKMTEDSQHCMILVHPIVNEKLCKK